MQERFGIVAADLAFPESLRWREDNLWFSDIYTGKVHRLNGEELTTVCHLPTSAGGIGWLPDGSLLAVDCEGRRVLRCNTDGTLDLHADLSDRWEFNANDMHVDEDGTAWVGSYGFNPEVHEPTSSSIWKLSPNGQPVAEVRDLVFPNGTARIDAEHLVVAETFADRLAIVRTSDRPEVVRRVQLPSGATPDGLTLAPDGSVWVALAYSEAVIRVDLNSGEYRRAVELPELGVYDCVFGKQDELYVATSSKDETSVLRDLPGRVLKLPSPLVDA